MGRLQAAGGQGGASAALRPGGPGSAGHPGAPPGPELGPRKSNPSPGTPASERAIPVTREAGPGLPPRRRLRGPGGAGRGGEGPALTHSAAGLQTLLLGGEVVPVAQAAAVLEGLTGHGGAVVEIPGDHPQAGAFRVVQLAGICGGPAAALSVAVGPAPAWVLTVPHLVWFAPLRSEGSVNSS